MEMGNQHVQAILQLLSAAEATVQWWDTTYARRAPTNLIRFSWTGSRTDVDYTRKDDEALPAQAIFAEEPASVVDYCCGKGLTGRAALMVNGAPFVGIELNKRRVAHLLDFYARNGFTPEVA